MSPRRIKNPEAKGKGKLANTDLEASVPGSNAELYPKFSLEHLQTASKYCLGCCDKDQKAAFAEKLKDLSQLKWRDIYGAPRHGNGFERIQQDSLNISVPGKFSSRKYFIAFRFHGKRPMVGFIEHDTFFVLWFDHDFSLYDHS